MKIKKRSLGLVTMSMLLFASCSDDDNTKNNIETHSKEQYVVAASSGQNDYLIGTENLENPIDVTSSNAVQAPGGRLWHFLQNKVAYGFIYNQTDPASASSYILTEDGKLKMRNELGLPTGVHTRGEAKGKFILAYSDRNREPEAGQPKVPQKAYFYKVDPETDATTFNSILTEDLLGNGEFAYFTDIAEYQGNIIAAARSLKNENFDSDYYNTTYIVVFDDDFKVKKVVSTSGKTGFVAGQWRSQGETGLEVVDNGDLYVFTSGQSNKRGVAKNIPSGILKINKGSMDFDNDYFFNITEASGGYNLFRTYYVGDNKFILNMYSKEGSPTLVASADQFAMVDVSSKEFKWITGIPKSVGGKGDKFKVGTPYIDKDNKRVIAPITGSDGVSYLYELNVNSSEAKKLGKINGDSVKGIGKLQSKK